MNKTKIKLQSPEQVTDFINLCSKYNNDINLYDGSVVIDGKSIIGVFSIQERKEIEVEMLGPDLEEIRDFNGRIKEYEVEVNDDKSRY